MSTDTGVQALFPVQLPRMQAGLDPDDQNKAIAQNENNLNQNFQILYNKLLELAASITSTT